MQAVGVFARVNCQKRGIFVQAFGQRKLHDVGMNFGVGVELVNCGKQFGLRCICGQMCVNRAHSDFFAGAVFGADINRAGRVVADQNRSLIQA